MWVKANCYLLGKKIYFHIKEQLQKKHFWRPRALDVSGCGLLLPVCVQSREWDEEMVEEKGSHLQLPNSSIFP